MTRRIFNFTGRKTIPHNAVHIDVHADGTFDMTCQFERFGFPAEARVYVEAFTSGSHAVVRFPFGSVDAPQPPNDRSLGTLAASTVLFNVKVVDESTDSGLLLGVAEGVHGRGDGIWEDASQQSLLPVNPTDLDQQVWRLTFDPARPWLEVNNRIDGIMEIARTDPTFFALVYPSVVRAVLSRICFDDEYTDVDGDLGDWRAQWLRWAVHWHPDNERPPESEVSEQPELWQAWINAVVDQFCRNHTVRELFNVRYAPGAQS